MGQRVSFPSYVGGFVTKEEAALAKFLAARERLTVSELIRRWLTQEAQKPLIKDCEVQDRQE